MGISGEVSGGGALSSAAGLRGGRPYINNNTRLVKCAFYNNNNTSCFNNNNNNNNIRVCTSTTIRRRRRSLLFSLSLLFLPSIPTTDALAASVLDKYVKRKQLDPLEAYVPAVILTQLQIKDLVKTLEADQPQYSSCRSLLRSGPAASLRVNIRAVAQYASDNGNGKIATQNVDQCLRALEDLDSLFLHASRKDPDASVKTMKAKIVIALDALDSLLGTVPSDVLDKGKAIADAYYAPDKEDSAPDKLDPELKQLESIL